MTTCLEKYEKLIFILVLLLGLTVTHRQMLLSGFALTHGDVGDSVLVHYLLEHGYQWAAGNANHRSYWDPPSFYPHKNIAAYTEVLLGVMPIYAIPRLLGAGPVLAYQVWFLILSILNFAVCYLFLRKPMRLPPIAAAAGAYLFSFASARSNQFTHSQLWGQFFVVLSVWGMLLIWRLPHKAPRRDVISAFSLCAAPMVAQLYANVYYAWFLGASYGVALMYAMTRAQWRGEFFTRWKRLWRPALLTVVLSAAAVAPAAIHYRTAAKELGMRPFTEHLAFMPNLQSWIYMGSGNVLYSWMNRVPAIANETSGERHNGMGFVTWTLIFAGFYLGRSRPLLRIGAVLFVAVFFCTMLWPGGYTLWRLIYYTPGVAALRTVSRWGLFLVFPFAMALACCLEQIGRRYSVLAAAVAGFAMAAEQVVVYPAFDQQEVLRRAQAIAQVVEPSCSAFLYSHAGAGGLSFEHNNTVMWAALLSGKPTINGESGGIPPAYPFRDARIAADGDLPRLFSGLRHWIGRHRVEAPSICWIREAKDEGTRWFDFGSAQTGLDLMVTSFYLQAFGRFPSTADLRALGGTSASPEQVGANLFLTLSTEPSFVEHETFVAAAYLRQIGRDADLAGWKHWARELKERKVLPDELVAALRGSEERQLILRKTPPPAFDAGPDRVFVSVLYLTLLQRPPNPEEARTLTAELAKGARKEILVRGLLSSPEFTGYAPR